MPAELSITFTHLEKEAASLIGSGRTFAQQVSDVLSQRAVAEEGQPAPDFLGLQLSLVRMVETELEQIGTYDESLVEELDQDRDQLVERNSATAELTSQLSDVQSACTGVYGLEACRKLFGGVETLPRDPRRLTKLGRRVHRRLEDQEGFVLPAPRLEGWALSERQGLATNLGTAVTRLADALGALEDERKGSIGSRFVKDGAVDQFRRTLRHAGDCLAALYGLAGFEDLARRIRPTRRRRRRSAGGDGDEPSEQKAEQGTESTSESGEDAAPEQPTGPTLVVS